MKKIFELKDFDTFVKELYESRIQKKIRCRIRSRKD